MSLMNTVVCTLGALVLHLLFEAPFANMEKVLLQKRPTNSSARRHGDDMRVSENLKHSSSTDEKPNDADFSTNASHSQFVKSKFPKSSENHQTFHQTQPQMFDQLTFLPSDIQMHYFPSDRGHYPPDYYHHHQHPHQRHPQNHQG